LRGDVTQHLSELASGEFARSTGAGDHLRQTLGHFSLLSLEDWGLGGLGAGASP
jgi:hypothetical protein